MIAEGTPEEVEADPASLTGQYLAGKRQIAIPEKRREPRGELRRQGRAAAQPEEDRRADPARGLLLRHRRLGVGQVHPDQRDALPGGRQPAAPGEAPARLARPHRGHRAGRQDHQHRPVADRPDAALEPGDLHQRLRPHPPALLADPRGAGARATSPGRFSFNVKGGRCEVCRGDGQIKIEMHFLPDVYVPCEQCHGKRYNRETLEVRFKGKSIADVLEMSVARGLRVLQATSRRSPGASTPSTTSGSTTSGSASRPPSSPAARPSG